MCWKFNAQSTSLKSKKDLNLFVITLITFFLNVSIYNEIECKYSTGLNIKHQNLFPIITTTNQFFYYIARHKTEFLLKTFQDILKCNAQYSYCSRNVRFGFSFFVAKAQLWHDLGIKLLMDNGPIPVYEDK